MHDLAEKWDDKNKNKAIHNTVADAKFLPKNRPCDWCGEPVPSGYIHDGKCQDDECALWMDILY